MEDSDYEDGNAYQAFRIQAPSNGNMSSIYIFICSMIRYLSPFHHLIVSINFTVPNQSRSRDEAVIAAAAAAGAKTIKYAPGEKPKTPKHADNYFGIDAYAESSKKDSEVMASSLDKIVELVAKSSAPTETPTKKKQRQLKDLTENIRLLLEEKSNLKKSEESTEDVDAQLRILREERMMLNSARGPGSTANLTDAFNDAA